MQRDANDADDQDREVAAADIADRSTMPNLDNDRYPYLLGGLGLIAVSLLGFFPVGMILSRWTPKESSSLPPAAAKEL